MILFVKLKNGNQIYEEIRTATVNNVQLVYYRNTYYTGTELLVDVEEIEVAYIITGGKEVRLI